MLLLDREQSGSDSVSGSSMPGGWAEGDGVRDPPDQSANGLEESIGARPARLCRHMSTLSQAPRRAEIERTRLHDERARHHGLGRAGRRGRGQMAPRMQLEAGR